MFLRLRHFCRVPAPILRQKSSRGGFPPRRRTNLYLSTVYQTAGSGWVRSLHGYRVTPAWGGGRDGICRVSSHPLWEPNLGLHAGDACLARSCSMSRLEAFPRPPRASPKLPHSRNRLPRSTEGRCLPIVRPASAARTLLRLEGGNQLCRRHSSHFLNPGAHEPPGLEPWLRPFDGKGSPWVWVRGDLGRVITTPPTSPSERMIMPYPIGNGLAIGRECSSQLTNTQSKTPTG
jgi:hypothetical protein